VKLRGATPTAYCWKLNTLDTVEAPQNVPAVLLTPKTLYVFERQHWPEVVHAELVEHAVPTEAAICVALLQVHVWLRPPKRTVFPLRSGLAQVLVTFVATVPLSLVYWAQQLPTAQPESAVHAVV
jgi:hypothetical protein